MLCVSSNVSLAAERSLQIFLLVNSFTFNVSTSSRIFLFILVLLCNIQELFYFNRRMGKVIANLKKCFAEVVRVIGAEDKAKPKR